MKGPSTPAPVRCLLPVWPARPRSPRAGMAPDRADRGGRAGRGFPAEGGRQPLRGSPVADVKDARVEPRAPPGQLSSARRPVGLPEVVWPGPGWRTRGVQRGLQWGHVTNGPVGRDTGQRVSGKGRGWGPAGRVSDTRRKQGIFRGGHLQKVRGKDPCPGAAKEVVQLQGLRRQKRILPQLWRPEVQSRRVLWAGSS